jgi:DNA-binding HxlR family transcriptional regulator
LMEDKESLEARKRDLRVQLKRLEDLCTPTPNDRNFMTLTHSRKILVTLHEKRKTCRDLLVEFDPQHRRTVIRRLKFLENEMECVIKKGGVRGKYRLTDKGEHLLQWARESLRPNTKPEPKTAALKEGQAVVIRLLSVLPKIRSYIDSCNEGVIAGSVAKFLERLVGLLHRSHTPHHSDLIVQWVFADLSARLATLNPDDQESFQKVVDDFAERLKAS